MAEVLITIVNGLLYLGGLILGKAVFPVMFGALLLLARQEIRARSVEAKKLRTRKV